MTGSRPASGLRPFGCRWATASVLAAVFVIATAVGPLTNVARADVTATTMFPSAGEYSFTVPPGVTSISVTAVGGAGGASCDAAGGEGASVSGAFSVTPGEQLQIGVGGAGGTATCGTQGGVGGLGGGGVGGTGSVSDGGGGGGGATVVSGPSLSAGYPSVLVIAAGGGGAGGGLTAGAGGDAGSPGNNGGGACGAGGAGTSSGGGAGGGTSGGCSGSDGTGGSLGLGGSGGGTEVGGISGLGGGGGGGGYYGGGGGASPIPAAGGGGGSSFIAEGTLVATPTSASAGVTLTYVAPTADMSAPSITFASTQPQGTASPEQKETVTNNGSAPLVVSGISLAGADPGDFMLANGCQQPVAVGSSCQIGVRFEPASPGSRSATMTLTTNTETQPAAIDLSGTGGALPTGATGATGPRGPAGKVEVVTCKAKTVVVHRKKTTKEVCTSKTLTGTVTLPASGNVERATLSRDGRTLAGERILSARGTWRLVFAPARALAPGRYTLTLHGEQHHRSTVSRTLITIE